MTMKVHLRQHLIVITAESEEEGAAVAAWAGARNGHVFALVHQDGQTCLLKDLGPRDIACREPINVTSRAPDPQIRLISNWAHTPFSLHDQEYASVETFWQGLKFPGFERRQEMALLYGHEARRAGMAGRACRNDRLPWPDRGRGNSRPLATDVAGLLGQIHSTRRGAKCSPEHG